MTPAQIDEKNADIHQSGFIGTFFIRPMPVCNSGEHYQGHEHYIDHLMNLVRGSVRIEWERKATGESGIVEALVPCRLLIKKDCWHKITALSDDTFWECWFSEAEALATSEAEAANWHLEKPSDG